MASVAALDSSENFKEPTPEPVRLTVKVVHVPKSPAWAVSMSVPVVLRIETTELAPSYQTEIESEVSQFAFTPLVSFCCT